MAQDPTAPRRSRRGSGAVTLHDVAKLAGVAPITASRALNTPAQVSEDVRKKVADAVARTGYVPNRLAGSLASTRSRLVAAVVPTIAGPVFLETVQSLTEALAEHGYQLMLGQAGYTGNREDALLDAIIGRRPDGIVLTGIGLTFVHGFPAVDPIVQQPIEIACMFALQMRPYVLAPHPLHNLT
jgi:LacI family gluconate utilization system Gnt-I transcriptional repressor